MKFKVCIVDDQISMRKAMRRVLQSDPQVVVFDFGNVSDAVNFLSKHHVDVVVTDIFLENGSGFEVLRYVRTRPVLNELPVLFVTGEGSKDDIVSAIDSGVTDYILKPFEVDDLLNKVRNAVLKFHNPSLREQAIRQGEAALIEGDLGLARQRFDEAEALLTGPEGQSVASPRAQVGLARVEIAEDSFAAAMRRLHQTMNDFPMYFPAHSLLVDALLALGRRVEAAAVLERELEINGKQPHRRMLIADLLTEAGDAQRAVFHLRQAIIENPKDERLLLKMAAIHAGVGAGDKAIHYYLKTRRVAGASREALQGIVDVCQAAGDLKRALQLLTDQLNGNRSAHEVYLFRSRVHDHMGNHAEAFADAEAYLLRHPDDLAALRQKARSLGKLGRSEEKCTTLARICEVESSHENESRAGLAFLKCDLFAQAVGHYTNAVKLAPASTKYRYNLAYSLEQLGQFDRARAMLQTVLKIDPDHHEAQLLLHRLCA